MEGWVWLSFKKNTKLDLLEEKANPRKDSQRLSQLIDKNSMARVKEWGIGKGQDKEDVLREEWAREGERVS